MRRCRIPGVGHGVEGLEEIERQKKQSLPLHGRREGKISMGWRRILTLRVAREGKVKPFKSLFERGLSTGQKGEKFFRKLADAPFQMKEGSDGVGRKEGESPAGETSSAFRMVCPLAWHRLPARGGYSLQVHPVVLLGHGADGAQCHEGGHRDL